MTDKVQKIREEVERLRNLHQMKYQQLDTNDNMSLVECGKRNLCNELLSFIDSLQEEPVSNSIDFEQELYKAFGQIKDFTLGIAIAKRFYDMGRKHKEPVSDELEEAAELYGNCFEKHFGLASMAFIKGAKWQKEQFEKNRLKHCDSITEEQYNLEVGFIDSHIDKYNRMPTFLDAIEYGMEKMKEEMMAKAIDGIARPDDGEVWCDLKPFNLKDGDKVKVIIIKEG